MELEEIQALLQTIDEAIQGEKEPKKLVKMQSKLVEAMVSIEEIYANQWLAAKQSGVKVTDGYAEIMAKAGTHGLKEGIRGMFEVITNLLRL